MYIFLSSSDDSDIQPGWEPLLFGICFQCLQEALSSESFPFITTLFPVGFQPPHSLELPLPRSSSLLSHLAQQLGSARHGGTPFELETRPTLDFHMLGCPTSQILPSQFICCPSPRPHPSRSHAWSSGWAPFSAPSALFC